MSAPAHYVWCMADSSSLPHFLPESAQCIVGFGEYVIDYHVIDSLSGEGASLVGGITSDLSFVPAFGS